MTPRGGVAMAGNPQASAGEVEVGGSLLPAEASPADDAGWRCPVCGAMAGPQDLDDDPDLPCWPCQQEARESWSEYVRESK